MEQLDPPDLEAWEARRLWFESLEAEASRAGTARRLSEQACALTIELQAVFCAGAWVAAVILAGAVVEMQADRAGGQLDVAGEDLRWLRQKRNCLVHESGPEPALTIEDQWTRRRVWEGHAKRAVTIVFQALYPEEVKLAHG
ncbi:MAG: hypothetical protein WD489_05995 [Rhodovibrionaceae bacterium]